MQCPSCKKEIPLEAKYCCHCGFKIESVGKICSVCGCNNLPEEAVYCPDCGAALNKPDVEQLVPNKYIFELPRTLIITGKEKIPDITITLIGLSGTGRYCYTLAMFATMIHGMNGYVFTPTDNHHLMLLESRWKELVEEGVWPQGLSMSVEYSFNCSYNLKNLANFNLYIPHTSLFFGVGNSEREDFFERLVKSDTLILCISAETIQGLIKGVNEHVSEVRKYNMLLAAYVNNSSRKVNVAITITKADLLKGNDLLKELEC